MAIAEQLTQDIITDPVESANAAGLRYVSDTRPGIRRKKAGRGFTYVNQNGETIKDPKLLERIKTLRIPPAWHDVWICPNPKGHIQATGRDDKNRKQYIYHPQWIQIRDESKFDRMVAFGQTLPRIRAQVLEDMGKPGLSREKVIAAVVRLLETTLIRIGNEEYARHNDSYGLTTLRDYHANIEGSCIFFKFRGKKGIFHDIDFCDPKISKIVKRSQDLPGEELFQYIAEDGEPHTIGSEDVNEYIQNIAGEEFTAKDFRTWAATVLAALALQEFEEFENKTKAKRNITNAVKRVAERLGNTPAICRKSYIHPAVLETYLDGTLVSSLLDRVEEEIQNEGSSLEPAEAAILRLLQRRLDEEKENIIPAI